MRFSTLEQVQEGDRLGVDVRLLTVSEARIVLHATELKKNFELARELAVKMGLREGQSVIYGGRKWEIGHILSSPMSKGGCILQLERSFPGERDFDGRFTAELRVRSVDPVNVRVLKKS